MAKMRAVQVPRPGGPLELVEREIPESGAGSVRIRVEACGVCHSDAFTKEGQWPGIQYPRVPGHEVAGVIEALGPGVGNWKTGQRVGVGWHGGHCGVCDSCRRGDFVTCRVAQVPGIAYDGGYADYMIAPTGALARIPDELSAVEAAPLLCAGITTYNALRNSGARPGDLVAVLGLGGLGHLGVQFAAKMGFETVAIARGKDEEPLAWQLGARHYVDDLSRGALDPAFSKKPASGGGKEDNAKETHRQGRTGRSPAQGVQGEERQCERGGDQLQGRGSRAGGRLAPRLCPDEPHVDAADAAARDVPHRDRA